MTYDCIVTGAGAAGLFYAAGDATPGRKLILEKTGRPGQKLLMSGNGMCNITHGGSIKDFINRYGDKGSRIRTCLYRHNNLELMDFFDGGGVPLAERDDGKVFPASGRASDILSLLLAKAEENDWELRCSREVTGIEAGSGSQSSSGGIISLRTSCNEMLQTRKLVIASGGASYPSTGSDGSFSRILERDLGLEIVELKPALAPVYVENYPYGSLSGVSFDDVIVSCDGHQCRGPVLLTHRGFSGPAVLHMSQHVRPGKILHLNFLPEISTAAVYQKLKKEQPGNSRGISNYLSAAFGLPKSFTDTMFADPSRKFSTIGHKELENVCHLITDRKFTVSGTGGWNEAMVTAGGVSLDQIDLKTMRIRSLSDAPAPDIRIIGEALDINGDTGGYNLQFAYSSAMAAL